MPVTVTVPATTANLGPGFDCLGLALSLHNTVVLEITPGGLTVLVEGEGVGALPVDESNLVVRAIKRLFAFCGRPVPGLHITLRNRIPVASGLGGSAAAVLGGLLAANHFLDQPLPLDDILTLATGMEGHPDNVAPALYGGLVLVNEHDGRLLVEPVRVPPLRAVVVLPDVDLPTLEARAILPAKVPLADAVFNAGRAALLVHALSQGDYDKLSVAMQDRVHQPYRIPLIPGMPQAFTAAMDAGAAGVALSGAGPSVVAFAAGSHQTIAEAMVRTFAAKGLDSRVWILEVDTAGSSVRCD
ncbi:MAG TPA: homoserine kinase [Candidatus Sulfomarinibacteraceae bacterium]|nr:homoserine kinase [Candidatus Sulfomarinibacteraceae bacterium]